jgi:methanogenic corrinoid protein MtbC1
MKQSRITAAQLGITAAAVSGDSGLLYRLAAELLDDGVPFDVVLFDVLLRSERDVGLRWQTGDYLVSEEHAATASLETVIALLAGSLDQPDGGPFVVVATSEGDDHSLPARAVAAHLLYEGYRTIFLGANVLASDLRDFLESEPPDAVVLSCAMSNLLLGARSAVRESHAVGVPVLVGGRGFGADGVWAAPVGADSWAPSGRAVARALGEWNPDFAAAEASACDPEGPLHSVIGQRSAILAAAEERLMSLSGEPAGARLRSELAMALDAVAAAMLVDDRSLLDEFLAWQRETLTAHGFDRTGLTLSLSGALAPVAPDVAGWIETNSPGA